MDVSKIFIVACSLLAVSTSKTVFVSTMQWVKVTKHGIDLI